MVRLQFERGENPQQHMQTIAMGLGEIWLHQSSADVVFKTRDGASIYAHKSLFACASKFLRELFQQDDCCSCKGKKCVQRKEPTVITLHESIGAETVRDMLHVVYTGRVNITGKENGKKLMELCGILGIKDNFALNITPIVPGQNNLQVPQLPPPQLQPNVQAPPRIHAPLPSVQPPVQVPVVVNVQQHVPQVPQGHISYNPSPLFSNTPGVRALNPHAPRKVQAASQQVAATTSEKAAAAVIAASMKDAIAASPLVAPQQAALGSVAMPEPKSMVIVKKGKMRGPRSVREKRARELSASSNDSSTVSSTVAGSDNSGVQPFVFPGSSKENHISPVNGADKKSSEPAPPKKITKSFILQAQVKMAKMFKEKEFTGPLRCIVDGCSEIIVYENISPHFRFHWNNIDALNQEPVSRNKVQNDAKRQKVEHNSTSQKVVESSMKATVNTNQESSVRNLVNMDISDSESDDDDDDTPPDNISDVDGPDDINDDNEDDDTPSPGRSSASRSRSTSMSRESSRLGSVSGASGKTSSDHRGSRASPRKCLNIERSVETRSVPSIKIKLKAPSDTKGDKDNHPAKSPARSPAKRKSSSPAKRRQESGDSQGPGSATKTAASSRPHNRSTGGKPSVHMLPEDQLLKLGIKDKDKKFWCQLCSHGFRHFRELRTHYTLDHFWDQLKDLIKDKGNRCSICLLEYPDNDYLIQHMANFHNYNDKYLKEKMLFILNEERTVKPESKICKFCNVEQRDSSNLKNHFSYKHFPDQLNREFNLTKSNGQVVKSCPKPECGKSFGTNSLSNVISHMGGFHDEVLKYAAGFLILHKDDQGYIPVDDFESDDEGKPVVGVPYQEAKELEGKGELHECAKCNLKYNRADLKIHYLDQHYNVEFCREYPGPQCCVCEYSNKENNALHKHMVNNHEQFLISFLEKDGIELPSITTTTSTSAKRKSFKTESYSLEEAFNLGFCQLCNLECDSSSDLKKHYVEHMKSEKPKSFTSISCKVCSMKFNSGAENLDHMAITHTEKFIIPYMKVKGLWTNAAPLDLESAKYPPKPLRVDIKKAAIGQISQGTAQRSNARSPSTGSRGRSPSGGVRGCSPSVGVNSPAKRVSSPSIRSRGRSSSHEVSPSPAPPPRSRSPTTDPSPGASSSPSREQSPATESLISPGKCPECEFTGEDEPMKLHLFNNHFRDQIKAKYDEAYSNDKTKCPVCEEKVSEFGSLALYLTHLVSKHNTLQDILQFSIKIEKPEEEKKVSIKKRQVASKSTGGGSRLKVRDPVAINNDVVDNE